MGELLALLKELAVHSQRLAKRLAAYQQLATGPGGNPHARERALSEMVGLLAAFPAGDLGQQATEWHAAETQAVQELKEQARFEFGRMLSAALEGSGMTVRGQLPVLRVGLFTLKADFEAGTATVFWGPEIERLRGGLKLDPSGLAAALRNWQESLRKKAAVPEELARRLHAAYKRVCAATGVAEGSRVFLVHILAELPRQSGPREVRGIPARQVQLRPVPAEAGRDRGGRRREAAAARRQLRRDD